MIKLCAFADEAAKSINEQIDALRENQISLLELRSLDGINVKDITIPQAKEYFNVLSNNGIEVWSIGSPLGKVDISVDMENYLDTVKHVCELANVFDAKKIRVFSFFNAYDKADKVIDYLSLMVETAKKYGVELCHENEKEVYGDTVARVLQLKEKVKGLKFIYDPANFVQVGENMDESLNSLHSISEYFHIKDVIGATEELVPAGYGDGKILDIINRIERDAVLTLEPHLALFEGYSAIDNTVMKNKFKFDDNRQSFDFAVKSLKDLLNKAGYTENKGIFFKE